MAQNQTLLIIDDEEEIHYSFQRLLESEDLEIFTAVNEATGLQVLKEKQPDVVVMDVRLGQENGLDILRKIRDISPKQIVIIMTAYGTSQTAIEAMKLGAFDYILKPFGNMDELNDLISRSLDAANAMKEKVALPSPLDPEDFRTGIVGNSPAMQNIYKLIGQVSPTDATVLVTGESGTGKELVARAIYHNSSRSEKIFITINCAAIPENLLESELFGHEKGSFTGAVSQRIGKFEQCDGGTLFLDEIGEMPLQTQAKILRVLQEGEFSRVGGNKPIRTDVRIIAATNHDLWKASQKKEFREDLYYRLNVVNITLPSLRERMDDLPIMVSYFMNKWRGRNSGGPVQISEGALNTLRNYAWPGNVRELENIIQRAMVLASGETITASDLAIDTLAITPAPTSEVSEASSLSSPSQGATDSTSTEGASATESSVDAAFATLFNMAKGDDEFALLPAIEREFIVRALELTNGNQVQASKLLGITRATLRKRVDKFGIQRKMQVN